MFTSARRLKYRFLDNLDPGLIEFDDAVRMSLCAILTMVVFVFLRLPQLEWFIVCALLTAFMFRGRTITQRFVTFFLFATLALLFMALATLLGPHVIWYTVFLLIATFAVFNLLPFGFDRIASGIFALVIGFLAGAHGGDWALVAQRLFTGGLGCLVALVSICLWPYRPRLAIRRMNNILRAQSVQYLQWVFLENMVGNVGENRLQVMKHRLLENLQKTRQLLTIYPNQQQQAILKETADVFGEMYLVGEILARPTDANAFASSYRQLRPICQCLQALAQCWLTHDMQQAHSEDQQLENQLQQLQAQTENNRDLQAFCYIVRQVGNVLTRRGDVKGQFFS